MVARLNWGAQDAWPNAPQLTSCNLLAHDPLSSSAYPMITYTQPAAGNLPIQALVAKQWPTSYIKYMLNSKKNLRSRWDSG